MSIDIKMLDSRSFEIDIKSSKVLSIKIDTELLNNIDKLWRNLGYTSRSEFIRESLILTIKLINLLKNTRLENLNNSPTHKNSQPLETLYKILEEILNKQANHTKPLHRIEAENESITIK